MYLAFYSHPRQIWITGLLTLVSSSGLGHVMITQFGGQFSMGIFLASMVWGLVVGVTFYFFMKSLIAPVVQIYQKDIIISLWSRKIVPVSDVIKLQVGPKRVEIEYREKGEIRQLIIDVSDHFYANHAIVDGKFVLNHP